MYFIEILYAWQRCYMSHYIRSFKRYFPLNIHFIENSPNKVGWDICHVRSHDLFVSMIGRSSEMFHTDYVPVTLVGKELTNPYLPLHHDSLPRIRDQVIIIDHLQFLILVKKWKIFLSTELLNIIIFIFSFYHVKEDTAK